VFSSNFEILRFAICSACFDVQIDMHYIRPVELSGKTV
jgi:hypothetical protein